MTKFFVKTHDGRLVTLLKDDTVREHLSSELGYSKYYRNLSVNRLGFVASEITETGDLSLTFA